MVVASAPGKINLLLNAGPPRSDGYHALTSVFAGVGLREYVVARLKRGARSPRPHITTLVYEPRLEGAPEFNSEATARFAAMDPTKHLAVRAAQELGADGTLSLTVHKLIPVAGGMGGGSADAAATLVAVNQLLRSGLSTDELMTIGRRLGADVPACLAGGLCLGEGRGDQITQLNDGTCKPSTRSLWWVLVFFEEGLSTPRVFQEFDALEGGRGSLELPEGLARKFEEASHASDLSGLMANDLQEAVLTLRPELIRVGEALLECGASQWMVSGAGPTVVGLTESQEQAEKVGRCLQQASLPGVRSIAVTWTASRGASLERALPPWTKRAAGSLT